VDLLSSCSYSASFRARPPATAFIDENSDPAAAIMAFDQSYSFSGFGPDPQFFTGYTPPAS
jgi:hypothetical protein